MRRADAKIPRPPHGPGGRRPRARRRARQDRTLVFHGRPQGLRGVPSIPVVALLDPPQVTRCPTRLPPQPSSLNQPVLLLRRTGLPAVAVSAGLDSVTPGDLIDDFGRVHVAEPFMTGTPYDHTARSRSRVRKTSRRPPSRCPHSRRPRAGPGHPLLSGVLSVPEPDDLGSDSGSHSLSPAPVGGREDRRPPGTGRDAARSARSCSGRRADRGADELARRLGAPTDQRRAEQHAPGATAKRRRRRVAAGRREGARVLDEGAH